ncbi:hypothetical protein KCTC52924_03751 [Arenibacter antarcticus]
MASHYCEQQYYLRNQVICVQSEHSKQLALLLVQSNLKNVATAKFN